MLLAYTKPAQLVAIASLVLLSSCSLNKQNERRTSENSVTVSYLLSDPGTGNPLPDTPYRLIFSNQTIIAFPMFTEKVSDKIIHGRTDDRGYTQFITVTRSESEDHDLLRRIGTGEFGIVFKMVDETTGHPIRKGEYMVKMCDGTTWDGYSDDKGNTAYFSSESPCDASLYTESADVDNR